MSIRYGWRFFVEHKPWDDSSALHIRYVGGEYGRERSAVAPLVLVKVEQGVAHDVPALAETREDVQDGVGDVTGFLQAALDAAWERGLRPTGFKDHTNELTAVRYHLEDMRTLAKLPPRAAR